jgi:3-deoxy-D-manno-octulosonic-acid transferase
VASAALGGWVGARFNPKLARGLAGRHGLEARLAAWGQSFRDTRRPLIWFHAPSVGEGLQVTPVIAALRAAHPDWQLAFTFFSPSAERLTRGLSVDYADYLPLDRPRAVAAALTALAPTALVFGKLDVWPELALAAVRRGARLGLIAATVAPHSSRLAWPVRRWLVPAYAALNRIGAIAHADAVRLARLGARPEAITVTGDTRYDSVAARAAQLDRQAEPFASLARDGRGTFTIVAGSTWPADERVLLPAFADLAACSDRRVRLIIAPHEPTARHLAGVTDAARRLQLPAPVALSHYVASPDQANGTIILVDRVGLLADLYALAEVAFVGGGYHRAGLHSVLEPAAFGVPVCVGPHWEMSRDADVLLQREAAVVLPHDGRAALVAQWLRWRDDAATRARAGAAAASVVKEGQGATARTVALVQELVVP